MTSFKTSIIKSSYTQTRRAGLKYLPTHYVKSLDKLLNGRYSKGYIRKVVQGVYDNDEILKAAFELSAQREKLVRKLIP